MPQEIAGNPEIRQYLEQLNANFSQFAQSVNAQAPAAAAAAQSAAASAAQVPHKGSKPPKPDTFSGREDSRLVRSWVLQVSNYYTATQEPEVNRLSFAVALLRNNALLWWQSLKDSERHTNWPSLGASLVEYFAPLSATIVARDNLARLVQRSSVKAYTDEFKRLLLNIPDISDSEKLDRYRRGLKLDLT